MCDRPDDPGSVATAYYRSIDETRYEDLRSLLHDEFVQRRPDRTIEGPEQFVQFMADDRPMTETVHDIRSVFRDADGTTVAVEGELRSTDGEGLFGFVDVFGIAANGRIRRLRTYTG